MSIIKLTLIFSLNFFLNVNVTECSSSDGVNVASSPKQWLPCDGCMMMTTGAGRGKDMANITGHRGKDISTILQSEEGKENGRPPRPSAGQRKKKRRRLNDLDSDSTVDEEESEDEFCLSERYEDKKNTLKFSEQEHFF